MHRYAYLLACLLLVGLVAAKFNAASGFTSLIRFGETWENRRLDIAKALPIAVVPGSSGYDGQFYAELALDPLLRSPQLNQALDAPSYRARRILAPAVAAVLGLGNPWRTLQAYALLNGIAWFALAWILWKNTEALGWKGFARWVGCMFSLGVLDSVRQSLVDLPALLFLALAVDSSHRPTSARPTLWLALGALTKETSVLGALGIHCSPECLKIGWKRLLCSSAALLLPLLIWSVYVHQRFQGSQTTGGLGNFDWPLAGLFTQGTLALHEVMQGNWDGRYGFSLIAIVGLAVQAGVLWRTPRPASAWWRIGAAYSLLLLFLSFWVWSGYWAACRAVLPLTVAFNLLLPANRWFWPLWIAGNLTLLHGVWRFL
jgi:hypothetical protein